MMMVVVMATARQHQQQRNRGKGDKHLVHLFSPFFFDIIAQLTLMRQNFDNDHNIFAD